tara:strand:+ start:1576 stop:3660 length:2085 start_codon:yes stop_codon:yes gene_type:complete
MNFNVISPQGNGFNYNVRFDEPIVIPENASITMNWGQFERDSSIRFSENQSITVVPNKVLPYWDYHNNGVGRIDKGDGTMIYRVNEPRNTTDLVFQIPAGKYTLSTLQEKINTLLGTNTVGKGIVDDRVIDRSNAPDPKATNPSLSMYDYSLVVPPSDSQPNYLEMGIILSNLKKEAVAHATHKLNITNTVNSGSFKLTAGPSGDTTGAIVEATWKGYSLFQRPYVHTGATFNQYQNPIGSSAFEMRGLNAGGFDEFEYSNTIQLHCGIYGDIEGDIFFGLHSESYCGVNDGVASNLGTQTDAQRTNGATLKCFQNTTDGTGSFVPQCYWGIRIMGSDSSGPAGGPHADTHYVEVYSSHIGNENLNTNITEMIKDTSIGLDRVFGSVNPIELSLGIQTYYDKGNENSYIHNSDKGTLHIRLYGINQSGNKVVIYDTNSKFPHTSTNTGDFFGFSKDFLESNHIGGTTANNNGTFTQAQAISSDFPFTPLVALTRTTDSVFVEYTQKSVEDAVGHANVTNSSLLDYSFTCSKELAQLFVNTNESFTLPPKSASYINFSGAIEYLNTRYGNWTNIPESFNEFFYRDSNLNNPADKDKYSIVMNNLPIKGYKNVADKSKSGYRKPILASIPNPFGGAELTFTGNIIGSYQSSVGITNRLSNQAMTTNNFDFLILDLETDKPAEQLTKSIINFTITAE